jgi:hypothetical protein
MEDKELDITAEPIKLDSLAGLRSFEPKLSSRKKSKFLQFILWITLMVY